MKVTFNDVEYRGFKAALIAIPSIIAIGFVFIGLGVFMTSPLWILLLIVRALS